MFTRSRTEALSDAVMAIALTLLVLDLRPPATGEFSRGLVEEWPTYLAYLTAFLTVATIWINHHAVFSRLEVVTPPVLVLNFGLLLGVSLIPWPTALISAAVRSGDVGDQRAAVAVYAAVTVLVSISWSGLNRYAARRPALLGSPASQAWLRRNSVVAGATVVPAVVAVVVALVSPLAALCLFLALLLTSLAINLRTSYGSARDARTVAA